MPSKQRPPAYRQTVTNGGDFRRLYWSKEVGIVPPLSDQVGVQEWFVKKDVWGRQLKNTSTEIKYELPDRRDIKLEKDIDKFVYERHGYTRDGAIARFLPDIDDVINIHDMEPEPKHEELKRPREDISSTVSDCASINPMVPILPEIAGNHSLNIEPTTNKAIFLTEDRSHCDRSSCGNIDHGESEIVRGAKNIRKASTEAVSTKEYAKMKLLPSVKGPMWSQDVSFEANRPSPSVSPATTVCISNPQTKLEEIRARVLSRDCRSASRNYPRPRHRVEELTCNRRGEILAANGGEKWKAKDPKEISYFFLFTPTLEASHVGWKRYHAI